MQLVKLVILIIFIFSLLKLNGRVNSWNQELKNMPDEEIINYNKLRIQTLNFDTIIKSFKQKKIIVLGDQRHDVWNLITIHNFIIQNLCRQHKINFLHEASIYQFYYSDAIKLHKKGYRIGPADYHDIYFGGTVGDDLLDSLDSQKIIDSIKIFAISYETRLSPEVKFLYQDLINDLSLYNNIAGLYKIDTAFVKDFLCLEIENHEAIENYKYNANIKANIAAIDKFYDTILSKSKTIANKFKKRVWRCVYQSVQYYLAEKNMNLEKAKAFDLTEMTEQYWVLRDRFLYENVKWYLDEIIDTSIQTVISVSSTHAIKSMDFGDDVNKKINPVYRSLGMLLKIDPVIKLKLYSLSVIPVSGYHGMAINYYFKLPMPPKKSIEYIIANSESGIAFYDLNKGSSEFIMHPFPNDLYLKQTWNQFYDGVIFVKDVIPNFFSKPDYGKRRYKGL